MYSGSMHPDLSQSVGPDIVFVKLVLSLFGVCTPCRSCGSSALSGSALVFPDAVLMHERYCNPSDTETLVLTVSEGLLTVINCHHS